MAVSYITFANSGSIATGTATSGSFTVAAGDYIYAVVSSAGTVGITSISCSGDTMTQVGSDTGFNANTANGTLRIFALTPVATGGSKTISAVTTGSAWRVLGVIVVRDAASAAAPAIVTGTGTALSQTVTVPAGSLAVQFFGAGAIAGSLSGGTGVFNATDGFVGCTVRYATANATFAGTISSGPWAGVAIVLAGAAANTGAFFAMF